ncbi:MAG: hypothetical protein V1743_05045 [Nanoarchaeota archaeon]
MTRDIFRDKKAMTTPSDFTEFLWGLLLVALGFLLLFGIGNWEKTDNQLQSLEKTLMIHAQRNYVYFFSTPIIQDSEVTLADRVILSQYSLEMKERLAKEIQERFIQIPELSNIKMTATSSQGELFDIGPKIETLGIPGAPVLGLSPVITRISGSHKIVPLTTYLPSLDGSVITVEIKTVFTIIIAS